MWPQPSAWLQDAEASVVQPPVDEAKRWASGKGRKVGFAKARATFRGGGTGKINENGHLSTVRWVKRNRTLPINRAVISRRDGRRK